MNARRCNCTDKMVEWLSTRDSPNLYGNDVTISAWYKQARKQKCYTSLKNYRVFHKNSIFSTLALHSKASVLEARMDVCMSPILRYV